MPHLYVTPSEAQRHGRLVGHLDDIVDAAAFATERFARGLIASL